MAHQRAGIGVVHGFDAEQIFDFTLEARGRIIEGRHRSDGRVFGGQVFRGVHEPVLAVVGEEIVDFKHALVGAAVVGDHQPQFGVEIGAENLRQVERIAARNLKVQFVATQDVDIFDAVFEICPQARLGVG